MSRIVLAALVTLAASACAGRHRVDVDVVFLDSGGSPITSGQTFDLGERRGQMVLASTVDVGRLQTCRAGRSRLRGELAFPIRIQGEDVYAIIPYADVVNGSEIVIPHRPWLARPHDDLPLLNDCDGDQ